VAKYNQLLRIEAELADTAAFWGMGALSHSGPRNR
jgi:enolase